MSLTYYKISKIVTGVTGLLRAVLIPRNTVKAFLHIHFKHTVTAVTGLCTCARVKKNSKENIFLIYSNTVFFLTREEIARNTRNTRNNHCFYYNFYLITRNNIAYTRNIKPFTRNNAFLYQQG